MTYTYVTKLINLVAWSWVLSDDPLCTLVKFQPQLEALLAEGWVKGLWKFQHPICSKGKLCTSFVEVTEHFPIWIQKMKEKRSLFFYPDIFSEECWSKEFKSNQAFLPRQYFNSTVTALCTSSTELCFPAHIVFHMAYEFPLNK